MNHKTYMKIISDQFGGLMKEDLYKRLERLAEMVQREERQKQMVKRVLIQSVKTSPPVKITPEPEQIKLEIKPTLKIEVKYESMGNYDKAMSIIRGFNNMDWVHVSQVPEDIFGQFFAICEMHPEIEFDAERDFQYFRVKNFRIKSFGVKQKEMDTAV